MCPYMCFIGGKDRFGFYQDELALPVIITKYAKFAIAISILIV